jgi:hypothetical protein
VCFHSKKKLFVDSLSNRVLSFLSFFCLVNAILSLGRESVGLFSFFIWNGGLCKVWRKCNGVLFTLWTPSVNRVHTGSDEGIFSETVFTYINIDWIYLWIFRKLSFSEKPFDKQLYEYNNMTARCHRQKILFSCAPGQYAPFLFIK